MSVMSESELQRLVGYLSRNLPGFDGFQSLEKFGGGQSNPTYLLNANSGRYVVRTQPRGKLLRGAHRVDREFRVMQALAGSDVPVPEVHCLADADGPLGRMFFVMSFVDGEIHWDPSLPDLSPQLREKHYASMCETLAALQRIDVDSAGLGDFGRQGDYFERQISVWYRQYCATATDDLADVEALYQWLIKHVPKEPAPAALVHGDFRLDNLVFDKNGNVLALLDWELSTLGHPLADLAYQCMQWRLPNEGRFRGLAGVPRGDSGIPDEATYLSWYAQESGTGTVSNWPFCLAFSFFRLAGILQGVYKRALDGNASNVESAREFGALVPVLARLGIEIVEDI